MLTEAAADVMSCEGTGAAEVVAVEVDAGDGTTPEVEGWSLPDMGCSVKGQSKVVALTGPAVGPGASDHW